jgi:hypothetical protein
MKDLIFVDLKLRLETSRSLGVKNSLTGFATQHPNLAASWQHETCHRASVDLLTSWQKPLLGIYMSSNPGIVPFLHQSPII